MPNKKSIMPGPAEQSNNAEANFSDDSDIRKIGDILALNRSKDFVNRIINPKIFPVLANEDGSVSTHSMANSEVDGINIVYPTVIRKGGELVRLNNKEAIDYALKTGEFIPFKSGNEALWFAKNYKKFWDIK